MAHFPRLPKPTRRTLAASLVVALLAALGTVTVAGLFRKKPNPNEIVRNGLMVLASDLDLGEVYYTDTLEHTFTIHNVTDRPIEISDWHTSCNCTDIKPKNLVINGHQSAEVTATINVSLAYKNNIMGKWQYFASDYAPILNGKNNVYWTMQGRLHFPLKGNRLHYFNLDEILEKGSKIGSFRFLVSDDINIKSVQCLTNSFAVKSSKNKDTLELSLHLKDDNVTNSSTTALVVISYDDNFHSKPMQCVVKINLTKLKNTLIWPKQIEIIDGQQHGLYSISLISYSVDDFDIVDTIHSNNIAIQYIDNNLVVFQVIETIDHKMPLLSLILQNRMGEFMLQDVTFTR